MQFRNRFISIKSLTSQEEVLARTLLRILLVELGGRRWKANKSMSAKCSWRFNDNVILPVLLMSSPLCHGQRSVRVLRAKVTATRGEGLSGEKFGLVKHSVVSFLRPVIGKHIRVKQYLYVLPTHWGQGVFNSETTCKTHPFARTWDPRGGPRKPPQEAPERTAQGGPGGSLPLPPASQEPGLTEKAPSAQKPAQASQGRASDLPHAWQA